MSNLQLSNRFSLLSPSPIRKLAGLALQSEIKGTTVYKLNIGDPDIESPEQFIGSLKNWHKKLFPYSPSQGNAQFLDSLDKYYKRLGFTNLTMENLLVTYGGSESIQLALLAVCDPGEELITFEPFYTNYNTFSQIAGINIIPVTTDIENGFHLPSISEIEDKITDKTKLILLCNPNNPTGTVYSKEEIENLLLLAQKHNLFILSDEVYREFVYDGKKQVSLLSYLEKYPDNIIVSDSLSKRYSSCGLRLGVFITKNKILMEKAVYYAQARLSVGTLDQYIASGLDQVEDNYFSTINKEYQERRDFLFQGLLDLGIKVTKPEGAFYIIAGLPVKDADRFCAWLVSEYSYNKETVLLSPAAGFYKTPELGTNQVRIAYVQNKEVIKKSLKILEEALKIYKD